LFIGGVRLLESAHVRDLLSVLRLVANPKDEIGWMRYLTLWKGIGDITASQLIEKIMSKDDLEQCLEIIFKEPKVPKTAARTVSIVRDFQNDVAMAVSNAFQTMEELLAEKYKNQEWEKRRGDFALVEKLAKKHSAILEFIEEYVLNPVYETRRFRAEDQDQVILITIHSAKGTEREVCYVLNVSPQAYPSSYAIGHFDRVEEERRVLYVALTRAKDELIITRHAPSGTGGYALWAHTDKSSKNEATETYFFNSLPQNLLEEHVHYQPAPTLPNRLGKAEGSVHVGIRID
jgi:DNA helicase-2/ATP-dependent DNA helicase PcrA